MKKISGDETAIERVSSVFDGRFSEAFQNVISKVF